MMTTMAMTTDWLSSFSSLFMSTSSSSSTASVGGGVGSRIIESTQQLVCGAVFEAYERKIAESLRQKAEVEALVRYYGLLVVVLGILLIAILVYLYNTTPPSQHTLLPHPPPPAALHDDAHPAAAAAAVDTVPSPATPPQHDVPTPAATVTDHGVPLQRDSIAASEDPKPPLRFNEHESASVLGDTIMGLSVEHSDGGDMMRTNLDAASSYLSHSLPVQDAVVISTLVPLKAHHVTYSSLSSEYDGPVGKDRHTLFDDDDDVLSKISIEPHMSAEQILGVGQAASMKEIQVLFPSFCVCFGDLTRVVHQKAYKRLASLIHPDLFQDAGKKRYFHEKFTAVVNAYECLTGKGDDDDDTLQFTAAECHKAFADRKGSLREYLVKEQGMPTELLDVLESKGLDTLRDLYQVNEAFLETEAFSGFIRFTKRKLLKIRHDLFEQA